MHTIYTSIFFCFLILGIPTAVDAGEHNDTVYEVVNSAEQFFIYLKERNYENVWKLLTEKSKNKIVNDVHEASGKSIEKEDLRRFLGEKGPTADSYWNSFLRTFNVDLVLKESRWEIGFIEEHEAEIHITYRKSKLPARLKMHKENGSWKVGLVETFWTRKIRDIF